VGPVRVPDEAGTGIARITLRCPKWQEIASQTVVEILVEDKRPPVKLANELKSGEKTK
jgi:hypothetical protein